MEHPDSLRSVAPYAAAIEVANSASATIGTYAPTAGLNLVDHATPVVHSAENIARRSDASSRLTEFVPACPVGFAVLQSSYEWPSAVYCEGRDRCSSRRQLNSTQFVTLLRRCGALVASAISWPGSTRLSLPRRGVLIALLKEGRGERLPGFAAWYAAKRAELEEGEVFLMVCEARDFDFDDGRTGCGSCRGQRNSASMSTAVLWTPPPGVRCLLRRRSTWPSTTHLSRTTGASSNALTRWR